MLDGVLIKNNYQQLELSTTASHEVCGHGILTSWSIKSEIIEEKRLALISEVKIHLHHHHILHLNGRL